MTFARLLVACIVVFLAGCGAGGGSPSSQPDDDTAAGTAPAATVRKVPLVYARSTIARGRTIEKANIELREVPEDEVPKKAVCATKLEEVVGKIAFEDIEQGKPMFNYLFGAFTVTRLSDLVASGKRAVSISTNAALANPFLRQNDRVDIIGTFNTERTGEDGKRQTVKKTMILLEDLRVLAVDRTFSPGRHGIPTGDEGPKKVNKNAKKGKSGARDQSIDNPYVGRKEIRSVTLEMSLDQCQKLTLASESVKSLHLATRGEGAGLKSYSDIEITDDTIRGRREDKVKKESPIQEIQWMAGAKSTVLVFDKTRYTDYDEDADAPVGYGSSGRKRDDGRLAPEDDPLTDDGQSVDLPSLPE